jgi:16S rRNA (cytosine967-C5)-methyltransferase
MLDDMTDALIMVFKENIYASKAIMKSFKNHQEWDNQAKGYFSDTIYDIVRYWRLLWYLLKKEPTLEKKDLLNLIGVYFFYKERRIFNTTEIKNIDYAELEKTLIYTKDVRVLKESIPDWLDQLGIDELGKRWDPIINALNQKPNIIIRTNTLKITSDELIKLLKNEGIQSEKIERTPEALLLKDKTNVFRLQSFKEGFFEVQSDASQMVSIFLDPKPGMRVVDVCAGEGSKTLHLAALMKNKGKIIAMDTQEWKLKELRRRAVKAGAENIEVRKIDSSKAYKRLKGTADRLLIDAPCSGLGTLKRNPDIKWKLTLSDLERLKEIQRDLLDRYFPLLRTKGHMVYSVCSILVSEGEKQVKDFLERHNNEFQLIKEKRYWPDTDDTDGFYMALLERT